MTEVREDVRALLRRLMRSHRKDHVQLGRPLNRLTFRKRRAAPELAAGVFSLLRGSEDHWAAASGALSIGQWISARAQVVDVPPTGSKGLRKLFGLNPG